MTLPLQHPVVRPNIAGRRRRASPPSPGASDSRLCGISLACCGWSGRPSPGTWWASWCSGWRAPLIPLAVLWVGKLIVDEVVLAIGRGGRRRAGAVDSGSPSCSPWSWASRWWARGSAGSPPCSRACWAISSPTGPASSSCATPPRSTWSSSRTRRSTTSLERARRQTVDRIGLFTLLLATLQDLITLVTLAVALAVYVPWLLVLLVVAVLPSLLGETHFASLGYSLLYSWTPERRQLDYLRYIGGQRRLRQGAQAVRAVGLPGRPLRPALAGVLRGQQGALGAPEPGIEPARGGRDPGVLRRLRRHHLSHGRRAPVAGGRVHHRGAHLPRGLVPPEPRSDPASAAVPLADLRAEPLSRRPVQLPRTGAAHPPDARRAAGAPSDPAGLHLRERGLPLPGRGALGGARPRLHARAGRAARAGGRERRGQDHAGEAPGPALRPRPRGASCSTASTSGSTTSRASGGTSG